MFEEAKEGPLDRTLLMVNVLREILLQIHRKNLSTTDLSAREKSV